MNSDVQATSAPGSLKLDGLNKQHVLGYALQQTATRYHDVRVHVATRTAVISIHHSPPTFALVLTPSTHRT